MANHRKCVTVCAENDLFGNALRITLGDHDVSNTNRLDMVDAESDALVYRVDGRFDDQALASVAQSIPTIVLGAKEHLVPAVDCNCRGFLPIDTSLEEIAGAVETILDGGAVVPPDLLGLLLRHLVDRRRVDPEPPGFEELSPREREVFGLAARGARKEEIGKVLFISAATARTHLQRVYRKLGVHSQAELMALASRTHDWTEEEEM
jgi:DNA-binding NarL/FixJ family response regulator